MSTLTNEYGSHSRTQALSTPPSVFDQIAQEVGVTPRTVRRVLAGELRDTRPTIVQRAARIRELAKTQGYRPHAAARATRSGRFNAIAMLVGSVTPRYLPSEMVYGAQNRLDDSGMHMMFARLPDEQLIAAGRVPRVLEEWSVDGLLIHYTHDYPATMPALIARYQVPSIWINTKLDADCVYLDDERGGREATEYLLARGHRRIAYVNFFAPTHYSALDRRAGYERAMQAAGLRPRVIQASSPAAKRSGPVDDRIQLAHQLLASEDRPTAMLCYETAVAGPILHAAALRNIRVPQELSLVSFGRVDLNDTGVPITLMRLSLEAAGDMAAQLILQKLAAPGAALSPHAVPMSMFQGATCAPPVGEAA